MKDAFSSYPQAEFPRFRRGIGRAMPTLSNLEAQIAQYMLLNTSDLSFETGASLANKVGASEVTVSRLLRRLGYAGMRGLKHELKAELAAQYLPNDDSQAGALDDSPFAPVLDLEIGALVGVFRQCSGPTWERLIAAIQGADRVYVTGFQTVRGIAEDCARRLALARGDVRFLAAHDGMLAEWIGSAKPSPQAERECLVLIDVVPYAREAPMLAQFCQSSGRRLTVFTDELCHWAQEYTNLIVHARSRNGLFLESTVGITAALNLMVHAVAERNPAATEARLDHWRAMARGLNLF